jgi:hypothetical protein
MTTQDPRPGDIEIAVALGRIEEMLKNANEKLDRLDSTASNHAEILRKHTVEIELLKQRQGPKQHWTVWLITAIGVLSFIATFVTYYLTK